MVVGFECWVVEVALENQVVDITVNQVAVAVVD